MTAYNGGGGLSKFFIIVDKGVNGSTNGQNGMTRYLNDPLVNNIFKYECINSLLLSLILIIQTFFFV